MSEPAKHPTRPRALAFAAALLLGLYGTALYFRIATASLDDAHQPGIESLQAMARPGAVLAMVSLLGWLHRSLWAIQLARWVNGGATLCCAVLLGVTLVHRGGLHRWQPPESRTLSRTVEQSLLHPSFSNRSTYSAIGSGLFALALFAGAIRLRPRQNAQQSL